MQSTPQDRNNELTSRMKADFVFFLFVLWKALSLPSLPDARLTLLERYLTGATADSSFRLFEAWVSRSSYVPSWSGNYGITRT